VNSLDPARLPVVVGVGQLRNNRARAMEQARAPLDLIVDAVQRAADDSGKSRALLDAVDGIDVVRVMTWAYDDLPQRVAAAVDTAPSRCEHSDIGGNQPVRLLDAAAARVAAGQERVVLLCGGEALASASAYERAGVPPPWSRTPGGRVRWPADKVASQLAIRYGIQVPIRGYALYENGLRASLNQSFAAAQRCSAELLAAFSRVAAKNDSAWDPVERSVAEIETVTEANRMVCFPYTLRMVAQPTVDLAAAVLVTSVGFAREIGVDADRLVHVWGGAGAADEKDLLARPGYDRSPAMTSALRHALDRAGVDAASVGVADLYSCFPVVPKLAAAAIGLPAGVPWTATGGLNAFGAPANDYGMHAIVGITRAVRAGAGLGLVYGNGEVVTKHHAVLLASSAHDDGYVGDPVPTAPPPGCRPRIIERAVGPATIETFTVEHRRDGSPELGYVVGLTADGDRFAAHVRDGASLARLVDRDREAVGASGHVAAGNDGRNEFTVD
jgi:acetyl-CoA C-acetyltransferase